MSEEKKEWISPEDNDALRDLWSQYMHQKKHEQEMAQSLLLTRDIQRSTAEHDRVWSPTMRGMRSYPCLPQSLPRPADADRIVEQFLTQNKPLMLAVDDLIPNKKPFNEY